MKNMKTTIRLISYFILLILLFINIHFYKEIGSISVLYGYIIGAAMFYILKDLNDERR